MICVLASYPSVAMANPSPVAGPYAPFIGLFVETLLIAIILGSKGFDPIRFFYSWGLVTSATFLMLVGGFYAFAWLDRRTHAIPVGAGFCLFVLAEAVIVFVEAIALQRMTRYAFFRRRVVVALDLPQAINISLIVNFVSFLFGI